MDRKENSVDKLIDRLYYIDNIIKLIDTHPDWTRQDIRNRFRKKHDRKANAYLTFLLKNHYITEDYITEECKITDSCRLYADMLYDLIIELER